MDLHKAIRVLERRRQFLLDRLDRFDRLGVPLDKMQFDLAEESALKTALGLMNQESERLKSQRGCHDVQRLSIIDHNQATEGVYDR